MKKLLIGVVVILMGCGPTLQQIEGEKAFYSMLATKAANPIVRIKVADPTKPANIESIEVYSPEQQVAQYSHRDYAQPWLNLSGQVLSIAVPWVAAATIVHSLKDLTTSNNYTQTLSGTGNSASMRLTGNAQSQVTGNSNLTAGAGIDQTSTPTVVDQPAPVIVSSQ